MDNPTYGNRDMSFVSSRSARIFIDYLNLIEVSGYQDQFLRPNRTTMTDQVINGIHDLVDKFNGDIPTNAISSVTSSFMLPTSTPEYADSYSNRPLNVSINNGWREHRFVFLMQVTTEANGMSKKELITGYTDHADIARQNGQVLIDPRTVFYINNISTISTRMIGSGIEVPQLRDSYSVFGGGMGNGHYQNRETNIMTPMNMITSSIYNGVDGLSDVGKNNRVVRSDFRNVSNYPTMSYRNYNSPTAMVSKVIDSFAKKARLEVGNGVSDSDAIYQKARGSVADPGLYNSTFMHGLSNTTGYTVSTFDFGWLETIDPTIRDRFTFTKQPYHTTEFTATWDKPTRETQMALVTSSMVTTLMSNYSLGYFEFSATNMLVQNHFGMGMLQSPHNIEITNILGLSNINLDYTPMIAALEQVIAEELCVILSTNGEVGYHVHVKCDMNTDIEVMISFENQPEEIFIFPSFADSIVSPMLTTNTELYRNNSRDIGTALDIVHERIIGNTNFGNQNNYAVNTFGDVNSHMGHTVNNNANNDYVGLSQPQRRY